jgi:hypothetical protein
MLGAKHKQWYYLHFAYMEIEVRMADKRIQVLTAELWTCITWV